MGLGDLGQTHAAGSIAENGRSVDIEWTAADVSAFELGAPHAGAHPLDDKISFQLGDGADDDDHGAAEWTAGIEIFPEADVLDVQPVQLVEDFEEVTSRSGQPIAGPDQDDIELSMACVAHQLVESRALCLGAADPVGVFVDDLVAALLHQLVQIMQLSLWMLIDGRNAHVDGAALH